jgi:hypothetical protein
MHRLVVVRAALTFYKFNPLAAGTPGSGEPSQWLYPLIARNRKV